MEPSIKSPVLSQTVWANILGLVAMVAAHFNFTLSPQDQASLIFGIGAAVQAFTVVRKVFFTRSVSPLAVKR